MISKKRALEILNIALKTGAEYAEIYQQEEIKRVISVNFKREITLLISSCIKITI